MFERSGLLIVVVFVSGCAVSGPPSVSEVAILSTLPRDRDSVSVSPSVFTIGLKGRRQDTMPIMDVLEVAEIRASNNEGVWSLEADPASRDIPPTWSNHMGFSKDFLAPSLPPGAYVLRLQFRSWGKNVMTQYDMLPDSWA